MLTYNYGVSLGPISSEDRHVPFEWRNNPKIYKWCRQYQPISWEQHCAWHDSLPSRKDVSMFLIYDLFGQAVGVCGLTSIDLVNRHAEFSLYIGPECQKKGYATAALKTLVQYGFNVLGLNHIYGETFDENPAVKCFEKVGFKKEGTRRGYYFREGKFIDAHLYSLMRSEWST